MTLGRSIAIKVMKPEPGPDGAENCMRFLREARGMAAIKHDNLITVHQVGQQGDVVYLVMELLEGETLGARLQARRKRNVYGILRIAREITAGLIEIHRHGMVHRDLKPDNIWLERPRERVKILDFGLARKVKGDVKLTQTGAVLGTPSYMAPEQARGLAPDQRCDLFSLGCILYYMCCGVKPFAGDSLLAVLTAIAVDHPTPVEELNPAIPQPLCDLIMQLLSKDREDRPNSAQEVLDRLKQIQLGRSRAPRKRNWPGLRAVTRLCRGYWKMVNGFQPSKWPRPNRQLPALFRSRFTGNIVR